MNDMEKIIKAFRRIMKALEGFTPEEIQDLHDQAYAQLQAIQHLKAEAEKRVQLLTQTTALSKRNNLRRTRNNRYANCPVMGGF